MPRTEVVHLTFKPPFSPGSYNRWIGKLLDYLPDIPQAAISYWNAPIPANAQPDERVFLINEQGLSWPQRATLLLPERVRNRWFNGVARRENLVYLWGVLETLAQLRPPVVICHDNYKFGALLRQHIDWPCRLMLIQHGLSYHLPTASALPLYSLKSFDVVCVMTRTSYRFDRSRMAAYESLVEILPSMIDARQFRPALADEKAALRAQWQLPPEKRIVLSLSRLVGQKGVHVVLESWPEILRACPDAFFWIVGEGDASYKRYLQSLINTLGISDSVRLQGAAAPELTAGCYRAADLFVFPTLVSEGFSFALLEAMASGLPCVSSHQDSIAESYPPDCIRLVRDVNIRGEFAAPLVELLRDDQARANQGRAARAYVEQHYSLETLLPQVAQFFRRQIKLAGGVG